MRDYKPIKSKDADLADNEEERKNNINTEDFLDINEVKYQLQLEMSMAHFKMGKNNQREAEEHIDKAIRLSKKLKLKDFKQTLGFAIQIFENIGDFEKACHYQEILLESYRLSNQKMVLKRKEKMDHALREAKKVEYKLQKIIQERVKAQIELEESSYMNKRREQINSISQEIYLRNAQDAPKFIEFIKKCIVSEERSKAQKALVLYSRITRETYEILSKEEVSLKKEWTLIKYYVDLLNLTHGLDIEVHGEPPDDVMIIPLFIYYFIKINLNNCQVVSFNRLTNLNKEVTISLRKITKAKCKYANFNDLKSYQTSNSHIYYYDEMDKIQIIIKLKSDE